MFCNKYKEVQKPLVTKTSTFQWLTELWWVATKFQWPIVTMFQILMNYNKMTKLQQGGTFDKLQWWALTFDKLQLLMSCDF